MGIYSLATRNWDVNILGYVNWYIRNNTRYLEVHGRFHHHVCSCLWSMMSMVNMMTQRWIWKTYSQTQVQGESPCKLYWNQLQSWRYVWRFPFFSGYSRRSWMVYSGKSHRSKWTTGGTIPWLRKAPGCFPAEATACLASSCALFTMAFCTFCLGVPDQKKAAFENAEFSRCTT